MPATGGLPKIAGLDTSFSRLHGLAAQLVVSAEIGMSYGPLFRNEASSPELAWGKAPPESRGDSEKK